METRVFVRNYHPYDWKDVMFKPGNKYKFATFKLRGALIRDKLIPFIKGETNELPDGCTLQYTSLESLIAFRDSNILGTTRTFAFVQEESEEGVYLIVNYDDPE